MQIYIQTAVQMDLNIYITADAWGYLCHGMYFKRVEQVHGQRKQMHFIRNGWRYWTGGGTEVLCSLWQAWELKRVQLLFQKQGEEFILIKPVVMQWGCKKDERIMLLCPSVNSVNMLLCKSVTVPNTESMQLRGRDVGCHWKKCIHAWRTSHR